MVKLQNVSGKTIKIFARSDSDGFFEKTVEDGEIFLIDSKIYNDSDDIKRIVESGILRVLEKTEWLESAYFGGIVDEYDDLPPPGDVTPGPIWIVQNDSGSGLAGFYISDGATWNYLAGIYQKASEVPNDGTAAGANVAIALQLLEANSINKNGTVVWVADQSIGGFKLINLANGTAPSDAVNKSQLDLKANSADAIQKDGTVVWIADQSVGGFKLVNLAAGSAPGDAVNKSQLDTKADDSIVIKKDGTVTYTADQPMGGFILTGLGTGSNPTDSVNKSQLDLKADLTNVILKDGSVAFTGDQSMGSQKLTNLANGTDPGDAVNRSQLNLKADQADVILKDGTVAFTGNQSMGGNLLTNVANPVSDGDAVNRGWVEDLISLHDFQNSVITRGANTPPVSPPTGGRYIVGLSPTGAWSGKADNIAIWNGSAWEFSVPNQGFTAYVENEDITYQHDGSSWRRWEDYVDHDELQNVGTNDHSAIDSHIADTSIHFSKDHGLLSGLGDDDHTQYHNDTRGDVRYYRKTDFINVSTGVPDAGKPIVLNANGKVDGSMISAGSVDHGGLGGLGDDDHTQYSLADGTRPFTGTVGGVTPTAASHLTTKGYVDNQITAIQHHDLNGLGDDDHTHYSLVDGTRGFTGVVAGITPTAANHLTTKNYVDNEIVAIEHHDLNGLGDDDHPQYVAVAGDTMTGFLTLNADPTASLHAATKQYVDNEITAIHHHDLNGLGDDDHTQYHNDIRGDSRYYKKVEFISTSAGVPDAAKPVILNAQGLIDNSMIDLALEDHSTLQNLSNDDHLHYHTDARGDIRYFQKLEFLAASAGAPDAGEPVVLNAAGKIDITMIPSTLIDHGDFTGLNDDDHPHYTLADGTRAFTGVVGGIDPTAPSHLTTKNYVDTQITTNVDHGDLLGLADDDHTQYHTDGRGDARYFQKIEFINVSAGSGDSGKPVVLNSNGLIDDSMISLTPELHADLSGLSADDHPHYTLADGTRAFTGVVAGVTPVLPAHLTTKAYVDDIFQNRDWQDSVDTRGVNTPPGTPLPGPRYILGASPSGGWSGHPYEIAEWVAGAWQFTLPTEGMTTYVDDENKFYVWNNTAWVKMDTYFDHTLLQNIGTYTHLQIDAHINDASLHFTVASIDHGSISGLADDDHPQYLQKTGGTMSGYITLHADPINGLHAATKQYVDAQIGGSVHHGSTTGLGDDDHTQYTLADGSRAFTGVVSGITPTAPTHLTTKQYVDDAIDSDVDHGDLLGLGDDDHTQYHNDTRGDARYFQQTEFIVASAGASDSGKPVILNASGLIDDSMISLTPESHNDLMDLGDDDHTQYHNDTRGDVRYFQKTEHLNASLGVADAGKPIVLNALGLVDTSMIPTSTIDHGGLFGLGDNDHPQYLLLSGGVMTGFITLHAHPTNDFHAATKKYVDDQNVAQDHGALNGLGDDDHPQYVLKSGSLTQITTRGHSLLTGIGANDHHNQVHGLDSADHTGTLSWSKLNKTGGSIFDIPTRDHDLLDGLSDDDHTQYSLADGTRAFTGVVGGITPTASSHLTTKGYVDALVQGVDWQESVLSKGVTTPPGSPGTGERYIIGSGATGAWFGRDNEIAEWNGSMWIFTAPNEGTAAWVEDESKQYIYSSSTWVLFGSTLDHGNLIGLGDDDHPQYHNDARGDARYVNLTGDTMTGALILSGAPAVDLQAATKKYVDDTVVTVHSGLTGLGADDHTQYHNDTRGDARYYQQSQFVIISTGAPDGLKPVTLDSDGKLHGTVIDDADIDHGLIGGLSDDDHTQYHTNTRGDIRYYQKTEFIAASAGGADAGKPIILDGTGKISSSMLNIGAVDHGTLGGLGDNDHPQYLLDAGDTMTGFLTLHADPVNAFHAVTKQYVDNNFIQQETFSFTAGRNNISTNMYLAGPGSVYTNLTPFIVPFDATIINITAATNGIETWSAEVHDDGSLITGASLSISSSSSGSGSYNIDISAGAKIMLYCNGSSINRPSITVYFKRRN